MQFLWQLDPCTSPPDANTTSGPSNPDPHPIPGPFKTEDCPGAVNTGPPRSSGFPRRPPGAAATPGLVNFSPRVPQAPLNSRALARQLSRNPSSPRVYIGPLQEQLLPWRWALTFRQTNMNLSATLYEGPNLLMDNVTAWAAESLSAALPLVHRAHSQAFMQPPFVCWDRGLPLHECEQSGANYAKRRLMTEPAGIKGRAGAPSWLAAVIACTCVLCCGSTHHCLSACVVDVLPPAGCVAVHVVHACTFRRVSLQQSLV